MTISTTNNAFTIVILIAVGLAIVMGCSSAKKAPEWAKTKRLAGAEQQLSHVSGIVADDQYVWITMGGTIADQNEGKSGLRRLNIATGEVKMLDKGDNLPQSETGGITIDDKYVYWNAGGSIFRIGKESGTPEAIVSENVGIGIDLAVDADHIYWTNHGYYSPNSPTAPSPIYWVPKKGGHPEVFIGDQNIPMGVATDGKYVYWATQDGLYRQLKAGGSRETILGLNQKEGIDDVTTDADSIYFGYRAPGESRWALRRVAKTGGEVKTLVASYSLRPVVIDASNVYFFDEDGMTADLFCVVPKNGGDVVNLDSGYASGVIAQNKTNVFFGSLDDIYSVPKR